MSLKPKQRATGRTTLDLYGYNDVAEIAQSEVKTNYSNNNHFHSTRKFCNLRYKQIGLITIIYLIVLQYFERIKIYNAIKSCNWNKWEKWPINESDTLYNTGPHHAILIGDPQIVDEYSYPNRSWLQLYVTKLFSDNYLHRNHQIYNKILSPDSILFIGDLFDGGREWNNTQWIDEYKRFNKVFNQVPNVKQFRQIPGNHDIGFGNGIEMDKYARFKGFFGNADETFILGNHSIVLLDTVSLSSDENPEISETSLNFLKKFEDPNMEYKKYPRIVLSHVPLYRFTEKQKCGPLRESKSDFPVSRGKQYQTVIDYDLSQNIVNWIRPIMLFSGDDHDYCHIRHPLDKSYSGDINDYKFEKGDLPGHQYSDEITIKSSAMTGGIKKPAIQLLSLWNPSPENSYNKNWELSNNENDPNVRTETAVTHLCYLPSPYQPLVHYSIVILFSIFWLFICTVKIDFGKRLSNSLQKAVYKLKKIITKTFKKNIKSIDNTYLEAKNISTLEKIIDEFIINWDFEPFQNWKIFFINMVFIVVEFIVLLLWYINSI